MDQCTSMVNGTGGHDDRGSAARNVQILQENWELGSSSFWPWAERTYFERFDLFVQGHGNHVNARFIGHEGGIGKINVFVSRFWDEPKLDFSEVEPEDRAEIYARCDEYNRRLSNQIDELCRILKNNEEIPDNTMLIADPIQPILWLCGVVIEEVCSPELS